MSVFFKEWNRPFGTITKSSVYKKCDLKLKLSFIHRIRMGQRFAVIFLKQNIKIHFFEFNFS